MNKILFKPEKDEKETTIVNVCVFMILFIGNTQISILLLCFLYLFVELMITNK